MIIGIDCRVISGQVCGISRYLINLLPALSKIDKVNQYILFSDNGSLDNIKLGDNFKKEIIISKSNLIWEQFKLPCFIKRYKVDIFHYPHNYGVSYKKNCKVILTIHDIIPRKFPVFWKNRPLIVRFMYNLSLNNSISKADRIIVVSENSRNDIIDEFCLPAKKITVIPEAVDQRFNMAVYARERHNRIFSNGKDYILHIAGIGFNKNTQTVLSVYENLKKKRDFAHKLLIVGNKNGLSKEILKRAEGIEGVIFTGYVSDQEMPLLYSGAAVFLYPSLYEGFGLPVLEAMASGVPVVVSNNSSLPEVVGDAGLYVDARDIEDISHKILIILNNASIRKEIISKGLERVSGFSWHMAANSTLKVYEEVMN